MGLPVAVDFSVLSMSPSISHRNDDYVNVKRFWYLRNSQLKLTKHVVNKEKFGIL